MGPPSYLTYWNPYAYVSDLLFIRRPSEWCAEDIEVDRSRDEAKSYPLKGLLIVLEDGS